MFERFDVNKSGTMCVRELGACLQSLGIDTTHTEAENALQVLTTHHLLTLTLTLTNPNPNPKTQHVQQHLSTRRRRHDHEQPRPHAQRRARVSECLSL